MSTADLPLVSMLRAKMQWHQARQKVLAENVANANTPRFQPRDLEQAAPAGRSGNAAPGSLEVERTSPLHLAASGGGDPASRASARYETRPSGNAVNLEDEMLKIGENQSDYQLAASLYGKSLALLRAAVGARSA